MEEENGSSQPAGKPNSISSLRDYFTIWINKLDDFYCERDKRYDERFKAQENIVMLALNSLEKSNTASAIASEKAVEKALKSQDAYNVAHNDLSHRMEAQYKEMISRTEFALAIKNILDKIEESKLITQTRYESNRLEISGLREHKMTATGRDEADVKNTSRTQWAITIAVGVMMGIMTLLLNVTLFILLNFVIK